MINIFGGSKFNGDIRKWKVDNLKYSKERMMRIIKKCKDAYIEKKHNEKQSNIIENVLTKFKNEITDEFKSYLTNALTEFKNEIIKECKSNADVDLTNYNVVSGK
jgi:hypothetical protein